eukprot:1151007-Pelagomonas_calceolata.AAC.4
MRSPASAPTSAPASTPTRAWAFGPYGQSGTHIIEPKPRATRPPLRFNPRKAPPQRASTRALHPSFSLRPNLLHRLYSQSLAHCSGTHISKHLAQARSLAVHASTSLAVRLLPTYSLLAILSIHLE